MSRKTSTASAQTQRVRAKTIQRRMELVRSPEGEQIWDADGPPRTAAFVVPAHAAELDAAATRKGVVAAAASVASERLGVLKTLKAALVRGDREAALAAAASLVGLAR